MNPDNFPEKPLRLQEDTMTTHKHFTRPCWRAIPGLLLALLASLATAQDAVQAVTLTLGDYRFTPDTIEVSAGSPVTLTLENNDTITPHNFILEDEASGLNIDINVYAGKSASVEFTPTEPGRYTFYCSKKLPFMKSHREKGMRGTLIVNQSP